MGLYIVVRIKNYLEWQKAFPKLAPKYVATIEDKEGAEQPYSEYGMQVSTCYTLVDPEFAEEVVRRYNHEHLVNNNPVNMGFVWNQLVKEKTAREKHAENTAAHKVFSYEWWYQKGRIDRRLLASPNHVRVRPYMDGWEAVEEEDRAAYGSVDFINQ